MQTGLTKVLVCILLKNSSQAVRAGERKKSIVKRRVVCIKQKDTETSSEFCFLFNSFNRNLYIFLGRTYYFQFCGERLCLERNECICGNKMGWPEKLCKNIYQ